MNDLLLQVTDLRSGYGPNVVVNGVDLEVLAGELSVVIGPNGHGKSTLVRTISGLVPARSGTITFEGAAITKATAESIVRRGLIHIPQGDMLFPDMTVLENLTLGGFVARGRGNARRLAEIYDIFPRLAERSKQRARTLSGGERRMLAIGRGLMSNARMLIIDEPSLGLAPVLVDEVYRQIALIKSTGMTILLVEENFSRVRDVADRLSLFENGQIVAAGPVEDVLSDPAIAATYLGVER